MLNWPKPLVLLILDGFGYSPDKEFNAIAMAKTPCWDKLQKDYPMTLLICSGSVMGLPDDLIGNSEVGHIHSGKMLLTADHGNIEQMLDKDTAQPHTAHTTNLVPLVYECGDKPLLSGGSLSDLTPTMLDILSVAQPEEMTGRSLIAS